MMTLRLFLRVVAGIGLLAIAISQIGCSALFQAPTPTEVPTETPVPPSNTPGPTNTALPTKTPVPSSTAEAPTETPAPSNTPAPTRTPRPTATEETESVGDDPDGRGADSQPSGSTPDPSRGQGVGEGQERSGSDSGQGAEAVDLDVCTLLTIEEVTDALGSDGEWESYPSQGSCTYMDASGASPAWVNVAAAQGDEAKWMLAVLVATFTTMNSGDPNQDMQDLIDELQEEMEDMTVAEIVEDMLMPLYEEFGFNVDEVDDIGDTAFWLWYGEGEGQAGIGELFIVRDDAYLVIDLMGLDDDGDSQDVAIALGEIALDRLPPVFDVLPDDYEDMLTPEP